MPPQNKKELEHFLGVINYYRRFIPKFADKVEILLEANRKKFFWSPKCQRAFESLKLDIAQPPVLKSFSLEKETTLTVDASECAAAGILSQDGSPVAYVSRSFTAAERNWSNIEREAYAVVWCAQRLRQFLLGRKFLIESDHRPLEFIFGNKPDASRRISQRVARWALSLAQFDFQVKYVPGRLIPHVDGLSRLKTTNEEELIFFSDIGDVSDELHVDPVLVSQVRDLFEQDQFYTRLIGRISSGSWKNSTSLEGSFYRARDSLSVENGLIYHKHRLYIPASYRAAIL